MRWGACNPKHPNQEDPVREANRREFFKGVTTQAAAIAVAPLFVPRSAFGANDRVAYGVIATGGRGRYLNKKFQTAGCQAVAMCDVYEPNLQAALKDSPDAKGYVDYRELLAQPGIDFVVLAGPDHHHMPMLFASLDAKKDVYAEKPFSISLEQSEQMKQYVNGKPQVVQIGHQRRSSPMVRKAEEAIEDGMLGGIVKVKAEWNWNIAGPLDNSPLPGKLDWDRFLGTAPKRALEPMRFRAWRHFGDYAGGNMTDQGAHLMDVVLRLMKSSPPKSAVCQGFVAKTAGSEDADVFTAAFEFDKFMATWSLNYCNSYDNGWSITFYGDAGTLIMNDDGFTLYGEPWKERSEPLMTFKGGIPVEAHIANFLECLKTRKPTNCTAEIAQRAIAGPHLANIAFRQGRKAHLAADLVTVS
ncbi:MAG: Gfo/Idh/MocA family oxidoreductase [Bryobacteraceae bacterium]